MIKVDPFRRAISDGKWERLQVDNFSLVIDSNSLLSITLLISFQLKNLINNFEFHLGSSERLTSKFGLIKLFSKLCECL